MVLESLAPHTKQGVPESRACIERIARASVIEFYVGVAATDRLYGHWEREQRKEQVKALAGKIPV